MKPETPPLLRKSSPQDFLITAALLAVPLIVVVYIIVALLAAAFPSTFSLDFAEAQVINFLNINAVATFVGDGFLALVVWLISKSRRRGDPQVLVKEAAAELGRILKEDREELHKEFRKSLDEDREAIATAIRGAEEERRKKEDGKGS